MKPLRTRQTLQNYQSSFSGGSACLRRLSSHSGGGHTDWGSRTIVLWGYSHEKRVVSAGRHPREPRGANAGDPALVRDAMGLASPSVSGFVGEFWRVGVSNLG